MSLRVTTSKIEPNVVVLHLAGIMAVGQETDALESLLGDLLRRGNRKLIFDLAAVVEIDADAALFLVHCFFAARGGGGELRFAAAKGGVARPFRKTMLDTFLPFDPTVAAALEHLRGSSQTGA